MSEANPRKFDLNIEKILAKLHLKEEKVRRLI